MSGITYNGLYFGCYTWNASGGPPSYKISEFSRGTGKKDRLGLRTRLLIFAVVVAVPLALVGGINLRGMWTTSRTQLDDSIKQQAALAALAFQRWAETQSRPVIAGATLAAKGQVKSRLFQDYLRFIVESHSYWIEVRIVDAAGVTKQAFPLETPPPPSALVEYLVDQTEASGSWVVATDRTLTDAQPVIAIAAPVSGGGAVIARIKGGALGELFGDIQLQAGSVIAVADGEGRTVFRRQTTGTAVDHEVSGLPLLAALGEEREAVVEIESPYDGVRRVYGLARTGSTKNVVIVGIPSAQLYGRARSRFTTYLLVGLFALACAIVAALFIERGITRPIQQLAQITKAVGAGDLTARVPRSASGEIGELGAAFNTMAQQLAEREARLRILDQMKSEFVGSVSHELRTPLTTIKTLTHVLIHSPDTNREQREHLNTIAIECDRQIDLVANLLDLSRIEAGGYQVSIGKVDISGVANASAEYVRYTAEARGQELVINLAPGLPGVAADRSVLRRALCTLLENAIKYTPEGGTIIIGAGEADGQIALSVTDTGQGIRNEDVPHVFEKFYRGHPADRPEGDSARDDLDQPGIGLGLYLARSLVHQMKGEIAVESRADGGSIFTIYLPKWSDHESMIADPETNNGTPVSS